MTDSKQSSADSDGPVAAVEDIERAAVAMFDLKHDYDPSVAWEDTDAADKAVFRSAATVAIRAISGAHPAPPAAASVREMDLNTMIQRGLDAVDLYDISNEDMITKKHLRIFLSAALSDPAPANTNAKPATHGTDESRLTGHVPDPAIGGDSRQSMEARQLKDTVAGCRASTPSEPAPAAPTREDQVEIACEAYALATGYYIPFHKGLSSESSDRMRKGMRAALAALSDPAPTREEIIEECAKAVDAYDPHRGWSADEDMQNQAYYTAGEVQIEIIDLIRKLKSARQSQAETADTASDGTADFMRRCQAYLDDAPLDGRHSDAAGSNAYELIAEAIEHLALPRPVRGDASC